MDLSVGFTANNYFKCEIDGFLENRVLGASKAPKIPKKHSNIQIKKNEK
jgi:hypothetical protein